MHLKTKENKVTYKILISIKEVNYLNGDGDLAIIKSKDVDYLIERKGKCKQCGKCCKFISVCGNSPTKQKYWRNFGEQQKSKRGIYIDVPCSKLKEGKCSIFKHKSRFPLACKQFPLALDEVYWRVMNTCGFYFNILMVEKKEAKACGKELRNSSSEKKK